jgi:hypothetical protein
LPKEIDFDKFEEEIGTILSQEQREWLAMLLHDHVSGVVANLALHVELIDRMLDRDMDIRDEFTSLKEGVRVGTRHIAAIEKSVRGLS